ncbi:hypothetical protein BDW59DRAFT_141283 [Aspergillus cavernicola]|uniref:Uncharacterized protein n=1 Tax=Aspergillus cavernicola TaxID=176166 RepID=A0ABR4IR49_9EURO
MRPGNDFMYFDIDLLEADAMDNRMNSGLMAKVDNPRTPEMGKSTFDELVRYIPLTAVQAPRY